MTEPETSTETGRVTGAPAGEQRVSVVTGERLCGGCGYNLTGQPVLREPHYDLLIVRCPECAAVACAQDYPLLGRWPGRLATIGAIAWLLVLLLITAGTTGAMVGITGGLTGEMTDQYQRHLSSLHRTWVIASHPDEDTTQWWTFETFDEFWQVQDPALVLAQAGGFWSFIWVADLALYLIPGVLALLLGAMLSIALLHRRRWALLLLALVVAGLVAAILATIWLQMLRIDEVSNGIVAWQQVGMPLLTLVFAGLWLAWLAGLLLGRTLARAVVLALVPPRLRGPLAILWTSGGLEPSRRSSGESHG